MAVLTSARSCHHRRPVAVPSAAGPSRRPTGTHNAGGDGGINLRYFRRTWTWRPLHHDRAIGHKTSQRLVMSRRAPRLYAHSRGVQPNNVEVATSTHIVRYRVGMKFTLRVGPPEPPLDWCLLLSMSWSEAADMICGCCYKRNASGTCGLVKHTE